MIPQLDVFSTEYGEPVWRGCANTIERALEIARKRGSGSYFVFSHETGRKTVYTVDAIGTIRPSHASIESKRLKLR
jgi:hypothetical protein